MKKRWTMPIAWALALCLPAACAEESVTVPEITGIYQYQVPDNGAMAFLKEMGVGWNLGNTFDAFKDGGSLINDLSIETSWVGVRTTKELIAAVHDAGFKTIRIPVSWHNHVAVGYALKKPWLDRVQEVVDYAMDLGMYVILNTHHDVYPAFYYPSEAYGERSEKYLTTVWAQLAERFQDYDEHLIFESMNEPRLKETDYEWNYNSASAECREAAVCINRLNQAFVDTVRASGSANASRYLMVPGYAASPENALNGVFSLPEDSADNRIIVSVHAYTPYSFALQDGGVSTFDINESRQTGDIDRFMDNLYHAYIAKGIPVVIGEFGARNKGDNLQERVNFAAYYTAAASARNMPCCWWDNHAFTGNGELFGLIQRDTCVWQYPEIVEAMMQYAGYDAIPAR